MKDVYTQMQKENGIRYLINVNNKCMNKEIKEKIIQLSSSHYVKDISKMTGIKKEDIYSILRGKNYLRERQKSKRKINFLAEENINFLKEHSIEYTIKEIADMFDKDEQGVRNFLQRQGLKHKPSDFLKRVKNGEIKLPGRKGYSKENNKTGRCPGVYSNKQYIW